MKEHGVKRTFLPSDISVLAAVLAAGLLCLLGGEWLKMAGYTLLLCWVCMLPFYHHGYRLEGQKGLFRLKELSVSRSDKEQILNYLAGDSDQLNIVADPLNVGALVDVYYQKSTDAHFARYFDYSDFASGKQYPLYKVSKEQITALEALNPQSKK